MARDRDRYIYLTIGIRKDSFTYQALLADAKERNMKQLPKLVAIRLGDYYRGIRVEARTEQKQEEVEVETPPHLLPFVDNLAAADEAWPE